MDPDSYARRAEFSRNAAQRAISMISRPRSISPISRPGIGTISITGPEIDLDNMTEEELDAELARLAGHSFDSEEPWPEISTLTPRSDYDSGSEDEYDSDDSDDSDDSNASDDSDRNHSYQGDPRFVSLVGISVKDNVQPPEDEVDAELRSLA